MWRSAHSNIHRRSGGLSLVQPTLAARANQARRESVCGRLEGVDVGRALGSGYAEARPAARRPVAFWRQSACGRGGRVCRGRLRVDCKRRARAPAARPNTSTTDVYTPTLALRADCRELKCLPGGLDVP
jgi:hypothetical protein